MQHLAKTAKSFILNYHQLNYIIPFSALMVLVERPEGSIWPVKNITKDSLVGQVEEVNQGGM